jgi:type I restriction enzyme, S subunit
MNWINYSKMFKTVKLNEVCDIISGSTPKSSVAEYWDGDINWVSPAELGSGYNGYYTDSKRKITLKGLDSCSAKLFPKGTVMLSSRAPIGKVAVAGREMCSNQGFKNLIPCKDLDSFFLYHWLMMKREYLNDLGRGATFKEISKSIVANIEIPLPSISVQKQIVKILEKSQSLITKRRESIALLDDFLKSTFLEIFGDPFINSKKWNIKPIRDMVNPVEKINPKKHENLKIQYVDISSINSKTKSISTTTEYSGPEAPERARQVLKLDDILVSTVRPNLNAVAVVNIDLKNDFDQLIGSTGFSVLRPLKKSLNFKYLFQLTKSEFFISTLVSKVKGANYPAVSNKIVLDVKIPIPPIKLQEEFADIVSQTELLKIKYQESEKELNNLFVSLLQRAFNGEIVND